MADTGLHLFLGADRPRKLQRLQELERSLHVDPLDRHHLDGAAVAPADLLAVCRQCPAASPVRLISLDRAHRLTADAVEALLHHAERIAQTACVVLLVEEELSVRHPLTPALRGAGPGRTGSPVTVEQFPGRDTLAVKPFALVDALGSREAVGALQAVHDQLQQGKEPLELLGLVAWQLQRWIVVKRWLEAGESSERIATLAGMRPWQVERVQSEVARRPLASLQALLQRCWQLDVDAKRGAAIPELAIEQLVVEVCQPSRRA